MAETYVKLTDVQKVFSDVLDCDFPYISEYTPRERIEDIPTADVVSAQDYKHLLKVARAMHTWIFLHSYDEQKAYDECHLTDEDNDLLGYGGQFILAEQQ